MTTVDIAEVRNAILTLTNNGAHGAAEAVWGLLDWYVASGPTVTITEEPVPEPEPRPEPAVKCRAREIVPYDWPICGRIAVGMLRANYPHVTIARSSCEECAAEVLNTIHGIANGTTYTSFDETE